MRRIFKWHKLLVSRTASNDYVGQSTRNKTSVFNSTLNASISLPLKIVCRTSDTGKITGYHIVDRLDGQIPIHKLTQQQRDTVKKTIEMGKRRLR